MIVELSFIIQVDGLQDIDIPEMKLIHAIICVWSISYGAALDEPNNARILNYDFENSGNGPYRFGFESSDGISRQETGEVQHQGSKHQYIKVTGAFSYLGPDGHLYEVRYTADDQGFHPEGDHIKIPPFVPWIHHHDEHEKYDDQQTTPKYRSSERILDVSRNYPSPSTFLPEISSAKPSPQPTGKSDFPVHSKPEAQTPIGYITPRPVGHPIGENSDSKYYIPPVDSD